jgi:hypothetical protein
MKNKLMTTALVSSMLGLGVNASVAQTTVSGNLELTYNAVTSKANPLESFRGFGKESQINIANKGKLSNGMDYAAGFSLEFDGPDVNFSTATAANAATGSNVHSENVYIDLIMGNTTLTFGADHIQNPDSNPTNIAGFGYIGLDGLNAQPALYPKAANSPYSAYGVGVMQTVPGIGTFSAYYAPTNNTNSGAGNDIFNSATATQVEPGSIIVGGEESAYELGFKGDLGVKGLNVMAFMMRADAPDGEAVSTKGRRLAATYTTGNFTVAVDHVKVDGVAVGATASATNRDFEVKGKSLGLGYALTPAVSASVTRAKADTNCSSGGTTCGLNTETTDIFAIGYNLGALTTTLQYKAASDVHGVADRDGKSLSARIGAKF